MPRACLAVCACRRTRTLQGSICDAARLSTAINLSRAIAGATGYRSIDCAICKWSMPTGVLRAAKLRTSGSMPCLASLL